MRPFGRDESSDKYGNRYVFWKYYKQLKKTLSFWYLCIFKNIRVFYMVYYPYPALPYQGHVLPIPDPTSPRPCTICTQPYLTKVMYCPYSALPHKGHVLFISDPTSSKSCIIRTWPYLTKAMYYLYLILPHQSHVLFVPRPTLPRLCTTVPGHTPLRPCTMRTRQYLTKAIYYPYSVISLHMAVY